MTASGLGAAQNFCARFAALRPVEAARREQLRAFLHPTTRTSRGARGPRACGARKNFPLCLILWYERRVARATLRHVLFEQFSRERLDAVSAEDTFSGSFDSSSVAMRSLGVTSGRQSSWWVFVRFAHTEICRDHSSLEDVGVALIHKRSEKEVGVHLPRFWRTG